MNIIVPCGIVRSFGYSVYGADVVRHGRSRVGKLKTDFPNKNRTKFPGCI